MRKITKLIVHCSATRQGLNVTPEQIDSWHRKRGFRCIGYHYVITIDGTVHTGRPVNQIGAHCKGQNFESIGICYVGGIGADGKPADTRTEAQRHALAGLIKELKAKHPLATIHGHNEFANKACPCFSVKTDPDLCAI